MYMFCLGACINIFLIKLNKCFAVATIKGVIFYWVNSYGLLCGPKCIFIIQCFNFLQQNILGAKYLLHLISYFLYTDNTQLPFQDLWKLMIHPLDEVMWRDDEMTLAHLDHQQSMMIIVLPQVITYHWLGIW